MQSKVIVPLVLVAIIIIAAALLLNKKSTSTVEPAVTTTTTTTTQTTQDMHVTLNDGNYNLDTAKSAFNWHGAKVGGDHDGTIMLTAGNMTVVDGTITAGKVTADVTTLVSNPSDEKLATHLKSADFFDVAKYPKAYLSISSLNKGEADYTLVADLTIKNTTKRIEIPVKVTTTDKTATITGAVGISAKEFNVINNPTFTKVINDKLDVSFTTVWNLK